MSANANSHYHTSSDDSTDFSLSSHQSLLSIAPGRSSKLYPVSAQSWCQYVLFDQPTLTHPCEGVHKRTLLMSLSLLLQQWPACHVCLIWMVCKMGGKWLYSCCFVGCCFQNLFKTARNIFVLYQSNFLLCGNNSFISFKKHELCFICIAVEIQLEQMYLKEVLDHLHSPHLL